jgi:hypothetical protein
MTRHRRFAIAALAAATVAVGSLATTPTASALPMSCVTARLIAKMYSLTGDAFYAGGNPTAANYWYGRALGVMEGACD